MMFTKQKVPMGCDRVQKSKRFQDMSSWHRVVWLGLIYLTRFNQISIQGTPQMAVDKEARAYRESTHIVILSVPCPYTKCNLP